MALDGFSRDQMVKPTIDFLCRAPITRLKKSQGGREPVLVFVSLAPSQVGLSSGRHRPLGCCWNS